MQIVLLEHVENLGNIGDVVTVKDGYARNYLLPSSKALRATKQNIEHFERERVAIEKLNAERKNDAEEIARRIDKKIYAIIRQSGESGQLYGSVTSRDISETITKTDIKVLRSQIILHKPIKTIGLHELKIKLHPEVSINVVINIARTENEAERQAKGEDIIAAEQKKKRIFQIKETRKWKRLVKNDRIIKKKSKCDESGLFWFLFPDSFYFLDIKA